ncbi:hypothetical protein WJX77_008748 [Trebouxia sp. C0004]
MYDDVTQKSRLVEMDSPLYMNYRCNANQVPIKLLHPIFGKFEHHAETVKPTIASVNFVHVLKQNTTMHQRKRTISTS